MDLPLHYLRYNSGANTPETTYSTQYRHHYRMNGTNALSDSYAPHRLLSRASLLSFPRVHHSYIPGAPKDKPEIEEIELTTFDLNYILSSQANSSEQEFFEAQDVSPIDYAMSSSNILSILDLGAVCEADLWKDMDKTIKPHMTRPLAPRNYVLDFSPLEKERGLTNVYTATPLARVREFHSKPQPEECTLLNILADEFDDQQSESPKTSTSVWKTIKHFTLGVNEDDFDKMFPWAKYAEQSPMEQ